VWVNGNFVGEHEDIKERCGETAKVLIIKATDMAKLLSKLPAGDKGLTIHGYLPRWVRGLRLCRP